jgi:hypothetical protein
VLNSLIFPAHEQHHNNSFLCASLIMGQSNIAAGATIGSNHNSRSADGEIIAGRGFWPGLCVSLKHNSKFASFTILSKSDFPFELNISLPFSLVSNDVANDKLVIMPGYWFMYNMYALSRNTWKYENRDKRTEKIQNIEYDYLGPDTVNEMFIAIEKLSRLKPDEKGNYLSNDFENSDRKTEIVKVPQAIDLFKEMITYYGTTRLVEYARANKFSSFEELKKSIPTRIQRTEWLNIGSQLMTVSSINKLKNNIKSNKINSWGAIHDYYRQCGADYKHEKLVHAYTSLLEIENITAKQFTPRVFTDLLERSVATKTWMSKEIYTSRAKDYTNPFRKMVYETREEMNAVVGRLEDNQFIQDQLAEADAYKKLAKSLQKKFK